MSTFGCFITKIDSIDNHPNADRLSVVRIKGYNCISAKLEDGSHRYNAGDHIVYIPEGAVLPDHLLQKMDFWKDGKGTLAGSNGNRVKAIRLRGVISQGILYPVVKMPLGDDEALLLDTNTEKGEVVVFEEEDVSPVLNIVKYEPPIPVHMTGVMGSLHGYTKSYDIDSIQKNPDVFVEGEEVVATEKIHGTLCQIGFLKDPPEDKKEELFKVTDQVYAFVTSKGLAKSGLIQKNTENNQGNLYVKTYNEVFKDTGIAQKIAEYLKDDTVSELFIFGEVFGPGVQSGYAYGRTKTDFRVFDICEKIAEASIIVYNNDIDLTNMCNDLGSYQEFQYYIADDFSMEKMIELRDGKTIEGNNQHIREGIVIRTAFEKEYFGLPDNRAQVKFVSPDYLLKETVEEIQ